jgi:hypothetical protein
MVSVGIVLVGALAWADFAVVPPPVVTTYIALHITPVVKTEHGAPITREQKALAVLDALEGLGARNGAEVSFSASQLAKLAAGAKDAWFLKIDVNGEPVTALRLTP